MSRKCSSCSMCCEGWIHGDAHGHNFYPGIPCFFHKKTDKGGCNIYKDRPENPCKLFKCGWLAEPELFPEWLKPELSKVIVVKEYKDNHEYYVFKNCGQELSIRLLDWIILFSLNNKKNIVYYVDGHLRKIGTPEFSSLDIH